eukprot:62779_1
MQTKQFKTKTQLQWKIDEETMKIIKSFDEKQEICSDFYDDTWCLRLHPKGPSWHGKEGDVVFGLCLRRLPPNVSKMRVQWTVHCHEPNIERTFTNDFDEEHLYYVWSCNKSTI